jgi:hypothetical protein
VKIAPGCILEPEDFPFLCNPVTLNMSTLQPLDHRVLSGSFLAFLLRSGQKDFHRELPELGCSTDPVLKA